MSWYERAAIMPLRSQTCSKAPGRFMPIEQGPLYALGGTGAEIFGEDGRGYIDMLCGLGAISLGYDFFGPRDMGGVFSLPHIREVEAAEVVLAHVAPWASSVKFTKTGSEATHAAYRIAKQATGRKGILIGDWAYHGWFEWCQDGAYVERFAHGGALRDRVSCEDAGYQSIAAVFIEPHRWEPVSVEWLKGVRTFCDRIGALLVFDSMIYGGRFALGGASEYFDVTPDLECFGKAMANGQAASFVVGREALAEHGSIVSGTFSGDVSGLSAVCDTLHVYTTEPVIDTLWRRGRQLQRGLDALVQGRTDVFREGHPVHQRLRFVDKTTAQRFSGEMAKRGVLWHQECVNVSYAHTAEQIERVIDAADESVAAL